MGDFPKVGAIIMFCGCSVGNLWGSQKTTKM